MTIEQDEEMPFTEGFTAVKITRYSPANAKGPYRFQSIPFPVKQGKTYKFSIWMRADTPLPVIFTFDGGSGTLSKKLGKDYRHWWHRPEVSTTLDEQWKEYSVTAKIPGPSDDGYVPGLETVWVRFDSENGTYWVANATVVEVNK